ncbi:MAG TPA: hypothetical protein VKR27_07035 [Acidimicrobiales bacterium]|nr:hypothetical protein [Acidimicrobiales bacterium]
MKGRWAAGIVPRNFAWVITDHLAVAERPGGSAPAHRRVRRREEILWLRGQGFTKVVSLLPSTHNLHAYEELELPYEHVPMGLHDEPTKSLAELYPALLHWLYGGERILVHQDELSERLAGVLAGFLWWSGIVPEPPLAISAIEQLLRRQLGSIGRTIVTLAVEVPSPTDEDRLRPERAAAAKLVVLRLAELERTRTAEEPNGTEAPRGSEVVAETEVTAQSQPAERRATRGRAPSAASGEKKANRPTAASSSAKPKVTNGENKAPSSKATKTASKRSAPAASAPATEKAARKVPTRAEGTTASAAESRTPSTTPLEKTKRSAEKKTAAAKKAATAEQPKQPRARSSTSRRAANDAR